MKIYNSGTKTLIKDADGDTYVKTEKNADEDKIRFGSGGVERAILDALFTLKVPLIGLDIYQSASSDNLDVSGKCILRFSTSGGDRIIGGLTGGVKGQILVIYKSTGANNLIIEHSEGVGDENILTPDGNDITLADYGGVMLIFSGAHWYVIAKIP